MIRADGEERDFFCRGHVFTDDEAEPTRVVGLAQDITDRVHAEREREGSRRSCARLSGRGAPTA